METQELVQKLRSHGIIVGPDHFVLGDGYGHPDRHASLFVVEESLIYADDLKQTMLERIWTGVRDLPFDLVVTPNAHSLPVAELLADWATQHRGKAVLACRFEADKPPEFSGRALIHDNVVNKGRQIGDCIAAMKESRVHPVALTSLFTRVQETQLFGLPVFSALERPLAVHDPVGCPLCRNGVPVNERYGKGREFNEQRRPTGGGSRS